MRPSRIITAACILAIGAGLAGCDRLDPNSPLAQRRKVFKEMTKTRERLLAFAKGRQRFDADTAIHDAQQLQALAQKPWQFFPEVMQADSVGHAKDSVWQEPEKFKRLAHALEDATGALATTAQERSLDTLKPAVFRVEKACSNCHEEFRQ